MLGTFLCLLVICCLKWFPREGEIGSSYSVGTEFWMLKGLDFRGGVQRECR